MIQYIVDNSDENLLNWTGRSCG